MRNYYIFPGLFLYLLKYLTFNQNISEILFFFHFFLLFIEQKDVIFGVYFVIDLSLSRG